MNINPFNKGNPMTLKDAATVSAIIAAATFFLQFLVGWTYGQICTDVGEFVFQSLRWFGTSFFGSFMALTGLEVYMHRKGEDD